MEDIIKVPQRCSTRALDKAKWTVFVQWCQLSRMDFNSTSIEQIADFLMYLFHEKNLQPNTIGGYKTAISDKVGNSSLNISKDWNVTGSRDRCKGR